MPSKLENTIIGLIVGGVIGGFAGAVLATQRPLRLNPEEPSPLDLSNEGFATIAGTGAGMLLGAGLGLASE